MPRITDENRVEIIVGIVEIAADSESVEEFAYRVEIRGELH